MPWSNKIRYLLFAFLFSGGPLSAQNHPELNWFTLTGEHFEVHYHDGAERTARVVAKIAEEIYKPITGLYDWEPDGKTHFIIKDYDDNSNGAAFYYDNKVEIWAPQMTFILRGTHNWLRNVVTHEFSHMVSLGACRKLPRRIPALYLQLIGYEDEKRPDVLYGYPNRLASYPVAMTVIPMWLAEGMAQFQTPGLDYDRWDTHRDMLIRTAIMADDFHSFDEMGVFGKGSLGNERTYNAGYAFTRFLVERYGTEALTDITRALRKPTRFAVNGALKEVTGKDTKLLYESWIADLGSYYRQKLIRINSNSVEGTILTEKGIGNTFPVWSPDGKMVAYCGGKSSDYLTQTNLMVYDFEKKKKLAVRGGVNSFISWTTGGDKLLYSRQRFAENHSLFFDIHEYDLSTKKEKRLTRGLRAMDPDLSADERHIVCMVQKDGTDNLVMLNRDGSSAKYLTEFENGEAVYAPHWSPDGEIVVFAQARNHGRDIKTIRIADGEISSIITDVGDARDPVYSMDGKRIYFSWDKTGIFNIYSVQTDGSDLQQWTNVSGGAFMPAVSADGRLAFSLFRYDGYKISIIENPVPIDSDKARYNDVASDTAAPELEKIFENRESVPPDVRDYDDTQLPSENSRPYGMTYGQLSFLPRILVDSSRVKLGSYFYASDILDRYSLLGGVAANVKKDLDLFLLLQYKQLAPTLFLELYALTRNVRRSISVIEDYPVKTDVDIHFNILESDLGMEFYVGENNTLRTAFVHQRYTSQIRDFFFQGVTWVSPANTYFIGNHFTCDLNLNSVVPRIHSAINPAGGRKIHVGYRREYNKFFKDFATDNDFGTPQEVYTDYNYNRVELNWHEYKAMPWSRNHALTLELHGGWIDRPIDSFFNFFAGGLPGLRGYPFYSIEGRKMLIGRFTYRFPLFSHWQHRFLHVTTDKMFLGLFCDLGDAFDRDDISTVKFKKNIGADVRFAAFSFYGFPTALSFEAAYGLDEFRHENSVYGKEWRYYFTLLFDFLD